MQPLDPITLAIIAVVVAIVLSALLLLLFATREEKFEDVLAAQRSQQEAYLARTAAAKSTKPRKKLSKGKKKYSDNGEVLEEVSEPLVEETIEASADVDENEFLPSGEFSKDPAGVDVPREEKMPLSEEKPNSGAVKERHGKKKSKKSSPKESSVTEHVSFDKPREDMEEVVTQMDSVPTLESEPDKIEELEIEEQKFPESNGTGPSAKKPKSKAKVTKDKGPIQGEVGSKRLMEMVTSSTLNSSEIQAMIDVLLNKQGENSQWKKSTSKGDTVELLRKQLQEKDNQILEDRRQSQNAANKLRELREELQQEKQKQKHQQSNATNKITAQAKEIQALQARMQASHESHSLELQNMQAQMRQMQEVVKTSSMGSLQRLQEENSQLKNASMRAAQLTSDKESLTSELSKLQQSYRLVKGDLASKIEQLTKSEASRKASEEKVRQLNIHQNSVKEAENALSKRLAEVNEELNKSQARNASLQKDLEDTKQLLKNEETKSAELGEQMKGLTAAESSFNSLTANLQEATARVSELENTLTGFENQLKASQEKQLQKDKEIQALQEELRLSKEKVQTSLANHVNSAPPAENGKEPTVSAKVQEDALKVKEDVIAELHGNVLKKDEEIASLKSLLDEQKNKNNALRQKNWKAMEALSEAEKSAQSQITKALEAAKAASDSMANGKNDLLKEKDDTIEKLQADLKEKKEECNKIETVVQQQKEKNNELREKNWKAMDALSEMEKTVNNKVKNAVQKVKDENKTQLIEEQSATKNALSRIHPNVTVDATMPYKSWLAEFEKQASEASNNSKELEELIAKFQEVQAQKDNLTAECAHYKVTLQETESLLRKLEDNVESEMDNWQKIVERTQRELKEANDRISSLEEDLQKAKGSASLQLDTVASLEERLKQAQHAENEAKQRFIELQEQLAKSTVSVEDANKIKELEKELEVLRAQEKELADTISKLESTEQDMIKCKKQLENAEKELADRDSELKVSKTELAKAQESEDELKKKVVSLEEAVAKANNDLGKSEKEKEKDEKQLEEAQRKISEQQTEIDDLKNAREQLEKQKKALEVEYTELKRRPISVEAEMTKSQQIEKDMAEAINDPEPKFHGTLKPADNFNPEKDAEALRKAMQGSGSDKDAIVAILGARTNKQRQEIAAKYQQKYGKTLTDDLKSELSGKFEDAMVGLVMAPESYDAVALHDAMSGIGTDEQVLIEILSSRSYEEIQVIKSAYTQIYSGKDVVKKLKEDTSGEFRTTLMNLMEKKPDSSEKVNADLAQDDAKKLFEAGEGKKGTDKAVFVEILTTRNYAQLRATFDAYKAVAKKDIIDYINDQMSGDLRTVLKAIVCCAQSPPLYFAEVLEKALDKTNSKTVARVMVTRAEVDLAEIKTQYEKKTGQSLKDVVVKKMKGDLEKILLQLLGH